DLVGGAEHRARAQPYRLAHAYRAHRARQAQAGGASGQQRVHAVAAGVQGVGQRLQNGQPVALGRKQQVVRHQYSSLPAGPLARRHRAAFGLHYRVQRGRPHRGLPGLAVLLRRDRGGRLRLHRRHRGPVRGRRRARAAAAVRRLPQPEAVRGRAVTPRLGALPGRGRAGRPGTARIDPRRARGWFLRRRRLPLPAAVGLLRPLPAPRQRLSGSGAAPVRPPPRRLARRARDPRGRQRRRPRARPAWRPHPLPLPFAGAAAGQDPALCADDGRARIRPWQARDLDQAGAGAGLALLARLRAACRSRGGWRGEREIHEAASVDGPVHDLRGDLIHYPYRSLEQQLAKTQRYARMMAEHEFARGKRATWTRLVLAPAWRFWRGYVLRAGFLDGWHGLVYAYVRANYVRQKAIMLWLLQNGQAVADPPRE